MISTMNTMALLVGRAGTRWNLVSSLLVASFILSSVSALSVSPTPFINGRSMSTSRHSTLFPTRPSAAQRSAVLRKRQLSASHLFYISKSSNEQLSSTRSPKKLAYNALSKITRNVMKLRRSILRTTAILSLLLFGFTKGTITVPHAHAAWGSKSDTVVVPVSPVTTSSSSTIAKLRVTKILTTVGAVAAGSFASKKLRVFENDNNDDEGEGTNKLIREDEELPNVVPKDKPSPLPLSSEWIETQLKDVEKQNENASKSVNKPKTPKSTNNSNTNKKDPILVKDLDSKIEMLRAREEQARANAEQKRLEDISKAEEVRKQEEIDMEARIAAEAQSHREREQRVQRKKEREREVKLAELESGKKEQVRLEQVKQSQVVVEDVVVKQEEEAPANTNDVVTISESQDDARSVDNVEKAKEQPKSMDEEEELKEKYGNMDLEDRAFNILVDLGMVDLHSDPAPLDMEDGDDNDFM